MVPKKRGRWLGQITLGIATLFMVTLAAAAPSVAMLANACGACHGTQGASAGLSLPNLAGLPKELMVDALKEFKHDQRPSTVMGRIAKGFDEADFVAMGEFFASQKRHVTQQNLDPERVSRGAELFQLSCGSCHVVVGRSNADDPPALASQWLLYMQMQAQMYIDGTRKGPARMIIKIRSLPPQDLESLLQYFASLQ